MSISAFPLLGGWSSFGVSFIGGFTYAIYIYISLVVCCIPYSGIAMKSNKAYDPSSPSNITPREDNFAEDPYEVMDIQ